MKKLVPTPRRLALSTAVVFCIGLVLLTLIGGSAFLIERMRQTALHAADATLQNAALNIESVVNRQFLQVDGALASLPSLFAAAAGEKGSVDGQSAGRLLRGLNFQTFVFRDLIILRPEGMVWASARPNSWNGNFPQDLLSGSIPGGIAMVGGPLRNPVTGEWVLMIVRHLSVPGVGSLWAVAEVPLPLVGLLLSAVGEIPGLRISLERRTGELIVSQPYDEAQIGKRQGVPISQIRADGFAFMVPNALLRKPSIGVARPSLYPDVMIALTLDLKTAMADWVRDRNRMIVLVTFAVLLLSALAVTLDVARRQRDRADGERRKARIVLDSAIEAMSDGFVMWDAEDRLVTCNQQYRQMYLLSAPFICPGARFEDIVRGGAQLGQYPQACDDIEGFVRETVVWRSDGGGPIERELPDGRWALITERKTPDGGTVGIRTDITDLKRALSSLAAANERAQQAMSEAQTQNLALQERDRSMRVQNMLFNAALNNMSQGLLMTDGKQRLIVYNQRFLTLFAIDPSAFVLGLPASDIFAKMKAAGGVPADMVESIHLKQQSLADACQPGMFVVSSDGGHSMAISQRPIADGGWVATYEDVSEHRRAEEHIRFAAHHDALTKLPNRVLFRIRLDEMICNSACRHAGLALLYLDLDRFKQVNDTLGHPIGDALLVAVGRRLLGCLRDGDIAARLGGDEFAIAYVSPDLPAAAEQLGQRIISALSMPYNLSGHTVAVGASVGIALAGDGQMDADTLLKNADMALYRAKANGRGVCSLFEPEMGQQLLSRLAIEEDLLGALDRGEFELLYQPLWNLSTDRIAGFEALIRWNHPVRGTVSPVHFIPIAEDTGMIRSIGEWALHKACSDAMMFPGHIRVAVNLSASHFDNEEIIDVVISALSASGLAARQLELEITETTLLKHNETTVALLFRLHTLGVRIALDDFGTGYSSLSYLRSFPFDKIKIDQSFVREMATRADCAAIVGAIVGLANRLNITTTAEGIETVEQLHLAQETGCTEGQGYLFSVPQTLKNALDYFVDTSMRQVAAEPALIAMPHPRRLA